ncbi:MAG: hypothetical protein QGF90_00030, partial [Gammaproteobacteria bacterium]|nr:hypothetical protein [Gammaproteobacteria bacterium]
DPTRISHAPSEKPFTASRDGFSLNAAVACQPWQRQRLERLCRYVTRRYTGFMLFQNADDLLFGESFSLQSGPPFGQLYREIPSHSWISFRG